MWAEWKTAYLLHKVVNRDPRYANGMNIAKMAWDNNARLVEQFFPNTTIGEISSRSKSRYYFCGLPSIYTDERR